MNMKTVMIDEEQFAHLAEQIVEHGRELCGDDGDAENGPRPFFDGWKMGRAVMSPEKDCITVQDKSGDYVDIVCTQEAFDTSENHRKWVQCGISFIEKVSA